YRCEKVECFRILLLARHRVAVAAACRWSVVLERAPVTEPDFDNSVPVGRIVRELGTADEVDAFSELRRHWIAQACEVVRRFERNATVEQHYRDHLLKVDVWHRAVVGDRDPVRPELYRYLVHVVRLE